MAQNPPKKGPHRMTTATKARSEEMSREQFEAELDAFAEKTHDAIQDAKSRMSDDEIKRADAKAKSILKSATSGSSRKRHTA
jgi:hypothetical protein